MEERLPPIPDNALTAMQERARAEFIKLRKAPLSGPFHVLLRSPELLGHTQHMGEYLRYRCSIAGRLSELAILIVARHWSQDYEWGVHRKHALAAGVSAETIAAIRDGRRPIGLHDDEQAIYDFVCEVLNTRRVSDVTYAEVATRHGEAGVVDLCGIVGYYQLLAITMNVARTAAPGGEEPLPRFPEQP